MAILYPHRQTLLIIFVCAAAIGGTWWYVDQTKNASAGLAVDTAKINVVIDPVKTTSATTSEWRKQFFIPNQNDAATIGKAQAKTMISEIQSETLTDRFGKEFFTQYMILRQNNLTENTDAVKSVIDQTMDNFVSSAPEARVYDQRSIAVSTASGSDVEKAYANKVGSIISTYTPREDAATIATQALEENDQDLIKSVDLISQSYSTMLAQLLQAPVPQSLTKYHVQLINGASGMVFVSQGMRKSFSDPLQGLVALAVYEKSITAFREALLDMKYAFTMKDFQFTAQEPAFIFNSIR